MNKIIIRKIISGVLLFGFTITGFLDALISNKSTFSSIMAMDISRVYFYSFYLLIMGCWLLYDKWFTGIGFLALAAFSSYFSEYRFIHNYFASVLIYVGIVTDIITRRKIKWLIPLFIAGILQGLAFQNILFGYPMVGYMEFFSMCVGSAFIVKNIE